MSDDNIGIGETHTTINDWETATDSSLTEIERGICVDGSYAESSIVMRLDGTSSSATIYRELKAGAGNKYNPIADTGATMHGDGTSGYVLRLDEGFCRLGELEIECTDTTTNPRRCIVVSDPDIMVYNCFLRHQTLSASATNTTSNACYIISGSTNFRMYNTIMRGDPTTGMVRGWNNVNNISGIECYNCGVYETQLGHGFFCEDSDTILENCWAADTENECFQASASFTGTWQYNASSDATADDEGGTGNIIDIVVADNFNDAANDDFRPVDTGADIYDAGFDHSTKFSDHHASSISIEDGVDHGDENATWEIGPYDGSQEVAAAVTVDMWLPPEAPRNPPKPKPVPIL